MVNAAEVLQTDRRGSVFDEYVSLGYNCEVAFQLRRALGRDESGFFNWGIFDIDSLIALIESRFEGAFCLGQRGWDESNQLARETHYRFSFHGPWRPGRPLDDPQFAEGLVAHRTKVKHLADRFPNHQGRRLYLCRPACTQPAEKVERLAKLLSRITPDATLVLMRLSCESSSNARHPMIAERILERAAPADAAEDGHAPSWDAVFAEFPHRDLIASRNVADAWLRRG